MARSICKTVGCNGALTPSKKSGARTTYCIPCDRITARARMRALNLSRKVNSISKEYYIHKAGCVYIITNPNFKDWCKVGCALSAKDRLRSFQTSSPHRDYELEWHGYTKDKLASEHEAHNLMDKQFDMKNEWFKCKPTQAIEVLKGMEWK